MSQNASFDEAGDRRLAPDMACNLKCPVCGSSDHRLYLDGEDALASQSVGSSRTKLSHGRILRCSDCGLCFRSFRPAPDQLAALYRAADDRIYEAEAANRLKTAARHRKVVLRYCPRAGKVLDIGSASGAFLKLMVDAGWTAYGVEPSASQCDRARRILGKDATLQQCGLEAAVLPSDFDVVTLWDVLEHVPDPVGFLSHCSSLLRSGGYLALNTPQIDSLIAKALGYRWPLLLAEHLNYFTVESLRRCGEKSELSLLHNGQRPVSFSLKYVLFRLSQHGIPFTRSAGRVAALLRIESLTIPIWMGEALAVFQKQ